ncbi:MAG: IS4 family transposase [Sphingobacteriales bacterium]|nr:IS4 family transposase [Sphingobacteriales bacterium]
MKAFETGFCVRASKFSPPMFIDSLLYDATAEITKSLNQLAINVNNKYNVAITKQGIGQRFTEGAVKYIQSLIGIQLSHQINHSIDSGWFKLFKRVLIKDSTKFDVSENLSKQLPGFGGNASKAGVCIQYEFDIKAGDVSDLTITPANVPDNKNTSQTIGKVQEGDLIIRDLGYSIISCFHTIKKVGAYFISRLNVSILVYETKDNKLVELDFSKLHKMMKEGKIQRLEKQVVIGKEEKLPVRIIIELMPEEVVNKRLKKTNDYNKRKGNNTSDNYKIRACFNLYITNIEDIVLEAGAIVKIYKIRWQVELIFKAWKSIFGIDNNNPMKYERLICLLNIRLLLILINWDTFMHKRLQLYKKTGKLLSINKCFKTLQESSKELKDILTNNCKKLIKWLEEISRLFESHHWLEKRKNKIGLAELMLLKTL